MDLTAAPYGGARYPVEARMDERIFARFHLDAGIGDVVSPPVDAIVCRDWLGFAGIPAAQVQDRSRAAVRRKGPRLHAAADQCEQPSQRPSGPGSSDQVR